MNKIQNLHRPIISFKSNRLHDLMSKKTIDNENEFLTQLHTILHESPELSQLYDENEGSYLHSICQYPNEYDRYTTIQNSSLFKIIRLCFSVTCRMIYALSNAGANVNLTDADGNTALHRIIIDRPNDDHSDIVQVVLPKKPLIFNKISTLLASIFISRLYLELESIPEKGIVMEN